MPVGRAVVDCRVDPGARRFPCSGQPDRGPRRMDRSRAAAGRGGPPSPDGFGEAGVKKILVGCLIVLVVAAIGLGVAGFYAYRWARPMIESTASYLDRARELSRLADRITNKSPYVAPEKGELTAVQVERFVAVQTRVQIGRAHV